ncbi:hypothetical protein BC940DRAFT_314693 [Gongronella butleri]|nr:hypothetical protein BC940DRAFT_314693 [Gongronella butleri]
MSMDAINHSDSSQLTECQVEKQLQTVVYKESPSSDDATDEEHTSWVAWMIVAIGTMINTSCAFAWMTASCTPIDSSVYFGIDLTALNWLSNTSAILNSVVSLPAAWCYEHLGLKKSIILSAVLNAAGCWIRCLAIIVPEKSRYAPMMAGQVLSSIGAPLIYK